MRPTQSDEQLDRECPACGERLEVRSRYLDDRKIECPECEYFEYEPHAGEWDISGLVRRLYEQYLWPYHTPISIALAFGAGAAWLAWILGLWRLGLPAGFILVFADVDAEAVARRDRMTGSREPLHRSFPRFKIWWWLHQKGPKFYGEAVEPGVYSEPSKNERHLEWLIENGWATVSGFETVHALVPEPLAELHAVELKLRDWEKAMHQAARASTVAEREQDLYEMLTSTYGPRWLDRWGYADYRWVALDAGGIRPALENEDVLREHDVGLISVAEGGTVHRLIEAEYRPRGRYTRDRAWAESEVWEQLDIDEWTNAVDAEAVPDPGRQAGLATYAEVGD